MTEVEWLTCDSAIDLLRCFHDRASDRKLRLFTIGCFRPWRSNMSIEGQNLLNVGERLAEGLATDADVDTVRQLALPWMAVTSGVALGDVVSEALAVPPFRGAIGVAHFFDHYRPADRQQAVKERRERCKLFRHIFSNSFRPYSAPPSWPSSVIALAQALYDSQPCDSALHDALLEAGHVELAEHFRETEHPKGCWALDLILGRE
jgi:hypothetical protein